MTEDNFGVKTPEDVELAPVNFDTVTFHCDKLRLTDGSKILEMGFEKTDYPFDLSKVEKLIFEIGDKKFVYKKEVENE